MSDLVGADIGLHVGKNFMNEWPERNYKAYIFPLLNEAGMLGEKSGKGFYAFDKKCASVLTLFMQWLLPRTAPAGSIAGIIVRAAISGD